MSIEGMVGCFAVTAGGLGATAAIGGLRLADLIITGLVMLGLIVLGIRNSRYLPVGVLATWMFVPLVRRIVDWQSGGYTSLTALSLLPMMSTSSLIIPLLSRIRFIPPRTAQALVVVTLPIMIAEIVGLVVYGPSAAVEGGDWLFPILFCPYLATRPAWERDRMFLIRACVVLATGAAAYGLYQFFVMPIWDALWLVQSGMTSSMGRPVAEGMHICGPMNFNGTAAAVWSTVLIFAIVDRGWHPVFRRVAILTLMAALSLTFVRSAWIVTLVGVLIYCFYRGDRDSVRVAVTTVVAAALIAVGVMFLPVGEKLADRLITFNDLSSDVSYQGRQGVLATTVEAVARRPFGTGLGAKTASKVAGTSNSVGADYGSVDNGYGEIFLGLGVPGGVIFLFGMCLVFASIRVRSRTTVGRHASVTVPVLARTVLTVVAIGNVAGICCVSVSGVLMWLCIGAAVAPDAVPEPTKV